MPLEAVVEAHGEVLGDGSLAIKSMYVVTENPHIRRRVLVYNMGAAPKPEER